MNKKSVTELSRELTTISKKARDGKLTAGEMQGGCFTISSIGGLGTTHFAPIVNAPEVAILGVSKSAMEPVWNGKEFVPRLMMPISLSFDHRVIDGADGARFITIINNMLSDIRRPGDVIEKPANRPAFSDNLMGFLRLLVKAIIREPFVVSKIVNNFVKYGRIERPGGRRVYIKRS